MDHLIEIAFKGNRKEFFLWEGDEPPPLRAAVIVEADRGEDLGRVHAVGELAATRASAVAHRPTEELPPKRARRLASAEDVKRHTELRSQDETARRRAMERVKANNLVMKLSDAEWQWDRRKLTIYFTAEKRVDFRNLVRDLAALFRTRIELKQIGVRDEAKRLGGIGRCGREYCSASWLPELRPVNLGVAKDQRLSLNPSQISGACGRLMCCLRYEHEFYVQSRKRFPKEGKVLVTARGEEKVVANDIFSERVTLRNPEGESRVVPLAELKRELAGGPVTVEEPVVEEEPDLMLELDEEVIRMTDTAERQAFRPGLRPGMPGYPTIPERPVALQRRTTPPVSGPREATAPAPVGDPSRPPSAPRISTAAGGGAQPVAAPATPTAPAASGGPTAASRGEGTGPAGEEHGGPEAGRPARRRRGRRGGRRGRGRADRGESLPNANGSAGSEAGADESGGDDE